MWVTKTPSGLTLWTQCPEGRRWISLYCDDYLRFSVRDFSCRAKEPDSLNCSWPNLGGWLEGYLGLISSCHQGHGGSLWASVPLGGTVDMVEMFHEGLDIPGPIDCSDQIWSRDLEVLDLWEVKGAWPVAMADWKSSDHIRCFCFQVFCISPWYTLKATTKTYTVVLGASSLDT